MELHRAGHEIAGRVDLAHCNIATRRVGERAGIRQVGAPLPAG